MLPLNRIACAQARTSAAKAAAARVIKGRQVERQRLRARLLVQALWRQSTAVGWVTQFVWRMFRKPKPGAAITRWPGSVLHSRVDICMNRLRM